MQHEANKSTINCHETFPLIKLLTFEFACRMHPVTLFKTWGELFDMHSDDIPELFFILKNSAARWSVETQRLCNIHVAYRFLLSLYTRVGVAFDNLNPIRMDHVTL